MKCRPSLAAGSLLALVLGLAACGRPPLAGQASSSAGGSPSSTAIASDALDREHEQAMAALDRWAEAVSAAGGPPWFSVAAEYRTGLIGEWESADIGSNGKVALYAGALEADPALPTSVPAPAEVRWADGVTRTLPLVSASDALSELQAAGNKQCGDCHALILTGAMLSSAEVTTSRGQATVPVWEFTLHGTAVRVTQVAVSPAATATVAPHDGVGIRVDSATGTRAGRSLTVAFVGSPDTGDKPCGADYDAEAVESQLGVVVIVHAHPYVDPDPNASPVACRDVGAMRTATVQLADPLGDRAVLDLKEGVPIPVTLE